MAPFLQESSDTESESAESTNTGLSSTALRSAEGGETHGSLVGLGSEPCLGDGLVEGVGVGEGGGNVADSDAEGRGTLRERVGGGDAVGDGDDLAAEKSGGDGLVEGVGVLVVDGLGRG